MNTVQCCMNLFSLCLEKLCIYEPLFGLSLGFHVQRCHKRPSLPRDIHLLRCIFQISIAVTKCLLAFLNFTVTFTEICRQIIKVIFTPHLKEENGTSPPEKKFEIHTNINCYVGNSGLDLDLRTLCDIKIKNYQTCTPYSKMGDNKLLSFCLQVVD